MKKWLGLPIMLVSLAFAGCKNPTGVSMADIGRAEIIAGDGYVAILDEAGNVHISNESECGGENDSFGLVEQLLEASRSGEVVGLLDGGGFAVGLRSNGMLVYRPDAWDECIEGMLEASCAGVEADLISMNLAELASWKNIRRAYGCFPNYVVGILEDGTAVSCGMDELVWGETDQTEVRSWTGLTEIAMAYSGFQVVALREDGEVYQIRVPEAEEWHHITMLAAGDAIYALTETGDVLSSEGVKLNLMKDIIYLAAGTSRNENGIPVDLVLGICRDGRVMDQDGNEWEEFYGCTALDISDFGVIAGVQRDGSVVVGGAADEALRNWAETVQCGRK